MGKQTAQQVAKEVRLRQRAEIVMACQASGMRKTDWCRQNGIKVDTYYKWQHQVREAAIRVVEKNSIFPVAPSNTQTSVAMSPPAEIQVETKGKKQRAIEAIGAWQQSGLSAYQWCKQQGVPNSTFYGWKKVVQKTTQDILKAHSVSAEQHMKATQMLQPRFTELPALPAVAEEPLPPEPTAGGTAIRIQMGGMVIEIQKETDARLAESVVRALAKQC